MIDPNQPDVNGGEIMRENGGRMTGIFIDNAMDLIEKLRPEYSDEEYANALRFASNHLISFGITGIHDAGLYPRQINLLKRAVEDNKLKIRVNAMLTCKDPLEMCLNKVDHGVISHMIRDGSYNGLGYKNKGLLHVRSVKLFLDGALGSWGALMIDPYSDDVSKEGILRITENKLPIIVRKWMDLGFQVNIHAIGDKANRIALDAFTSSNTSSIHRNRIEHAQIIAPNDIKRFAQMGIIPSMQPIHVTSDMAYAEKRLGIKRSKERAYKWRSLIESGVRILPLSSDFPVESADPLKGMHAALFRTDSNGNSPHGRNGWYPEQVLTMNEALKGFTRDAAYAGFQEDTVGSIEVGKFADYVVFNKDFVNDTLLILQTKVDSTFINGAMVYHVS